MKIAIGSVRNGGWIWFDKANLRRCEIGFGDIREPSVNWSVWWAIFGFSGALIFQFPRRPSQRGGHG